MPALSNIASQEEGPGFEPNLGRFVCSFACSPYEFPPDAPGASFHIKRHACKLLRISVLLLLTKEMVLILEVALRHSAVTLHSFYSK